MKILNHFFVLRLRSILQEKFDKVLRKDELFVFGASLFFYFSLLFNLNNKTLLGLFILFFILFYKRLKSFLIALSIIYLLFLPIAKGKTFSFILVPSWMLNQTLSYTYNLTISFADLAFLGLLILIIKEEVIDRWRGKYLKPKRGDVFLFSFLFFVFLSIFFSQFQLISFLAFLRLARILAAYFLIQRLLSERKMRALFPLILATSLIFQGGWASLQFLFQRPLGRAIEPFGLQFTNLGYLASEESTFFRAQGTFGHPNILGTFIVMFLAFLTVHIFVPQERKRKIFLIGLFFGLAGLVFSGSRASWVVALLAVMAAVAFLKKLGVKLTLSSTVKKWIFLVTFSLLIFLPLVIIPRMGHLYLSLADKGGVYYRTYLLEKAWFLALGSPLGIGLATFPAALIRQFGFFTLPAPVHNLFLEILVETGIFSLISFWLFLIFAYKRFFLDLKGFRNRDKLFLKTGAFFASLGFLGVAQFYPFFWSRNVFEYFWLFLGVMLYN